MTGYWKGITTSEAQTYSYSVGISSTDALQDATEKVTTLNDSKEAGQEYSGSATTSVTGGIVSAEVTVSGGGHESTSKTEENSDAIS